MKNQNGITLISLIITIIVMVILAGVAMTSIIGEDSVVEETETATVKMEEAEILEKIQTSTKFNLEGNIDLEKTFKNIQTNLKAENVTLIEPIEESDLATATEVKVKVKGNKGEYEYLVKGKNIEIAPPTPPKPIYDDYDIGDAVYYDENADGAKSDSEKYYVFTKSEDGNEIEIVRAETKGSIYLGEEYNNIDESSERFVEKYRVEDQNGDGIIESIDRAIYSYNNADKILNEYCKQQINATDNSGVRNIDSNDREKTVYGWEGYNANKQPDWLKEISIFVIKSPNNVAVDAESAKLRKMKSELGINIRNTWWIGATFVQTSDSQIYGYVKGSCRFASIGSSGGVWLWNLNSSGNVVTEPDNNTTKKDRNKGVLPIIKNPVNISLTAE